MLYKIDKSSYKNAIDNLDIVESEFAFIKSQNGKLELITYDECVTFSSNIKVIESDENSNIYKVSKDLLKKLFNSIYIIKKGIKDKAYIININANNLVLSVCTKDEIKEEQILKILNYKIEDKLSREELVKTVLSHIDVYTEKLQKKLNQTILDLKLSDLKFVVKTSVLEEYNTRSAKVNIENTISLTIPIEKTTSDIDFNIPENYFITDILQFKETYNILNRTSIKENFVNAMDNICIKLENDTCSFFSTDMVRISKCIYTLTNKVNDCRILLNKTNFQLLNKTIFKSDDYSTNLKVSINNSKICFESEISKIVFKNDTSLHDLKIDFLMSTLRMKNIVLQKNEVDEVKKECESLKKYIKKNNENMEAIVETNEENTVKVSKPKGLESYKIIIEFKENEKTDIQIKRTFEEVENVESKYIYNLSYFYSIMSSLLAVNYLQNNINIYFDDITKIAFIKTFNFVENNNHNYVAILPLKK